MDAVVLEMVVSLEDPTLRLVVDPLDEQSSLVTVLTNSSERTYLVEEGEMASVLMDAADGSYYKPLIKSYAVDGVVKVEQVDGEMFRLSWNGPSWNEIVDLEMAEYADEED